MYVCSIHEEMTFTRLPEINVKRAGCTALGAGCERRKTGLGGVVVVVVVVVASVDPTR